MPGFVVPRPAQSKSFGVCSAGSLECDWRCHFLQSSLGFPLHYLNKEMGSLSEFCYPSNWIRLDYERATTGP